MEESDIASNEKANSSRIRLSCNECNYIFSMKEDSAVRRRCPYCSSEDVNPYESPVRRFLKEADGDGI